MIPMIENVVTITMEVIFFGLLIILCVGVVVIRAAATIYWKDRCHRCKAKNSLRWTKEFIDGQMEDIPKCMECNDELYYQLP